MIPIRDTVQSRNYPVVNMIIIGLNILLYLIEMGQGQRLGQFIATYGLIPARYSSPEIARYFTFSQQVLAFFSFMFLHGGFWHLLGNMWSLYIFGDNVEDRLGSFRYLFFYLLCGWASGVSHLVLNWHSRVPTIGASGAIAGIMGAYLILYPKSRILTLIPIFFLPYFVEIPAFFFLGFWFLIQFFNAAASQGQIGGVAWWAHVGGFVFGMVFLKAFLAVPRLGITDMLRKKTPERKTPRLQVIRTSGSDDDPHLYGTMHITRREAQIGARKLISIQRGLQKRLYRVTVPAGIKQGTVLRLEGAGKPLDRSKSGDLFLEIMIQKVL